MKAAHVKFANPQFNYSTSINGTDDEIRAYFLGKYLNMGGMRYNHETGEETEVDDMQQCIAVEITNN